MQRPKTTVIPFFFAHGDIGTKVLNYLGREGLEHWRRLERRPLPGGHQPQVLVLGLGLAGESQRGEAPVQHHPAGLAAHSGGGARVPGYRGWQWEGGREGEEEVLPD